MNRITYITDIERGIARKRLRHSLGREPSDIEVMFEAEEIVQQRMYRMEQTRQKRRQGKQQDKPTQLG